MPESYNIDQYNISVSALPHSNKIFYLIVPEGLEKDIITWSEEASTRYESNIVIISGLNWNDDLTPWPAEGVFKKAKPFGGKAAEFLEKYTKKLLPEIEKRLGIDTAERTLGGISLSGLFAVWALYNSTDFKNIISISGSLWYDDFEAWTRDKNPVKGYEKVFLTLGDKEKNSKNTRIALVENATESIYNRLMIDIPCVKYSLFDGTHFTPVLGNLEKGMEYIYRNI